MPWNSNNDLCFFWKLGEDGGVLQEFLTNNLSLWDFRAKVGDFVGGILGAIFSLAGFFLLYTTFQKQKEFSLKISIDNRFYEMLRLHKENVDETECTNPILKTRFLGG
ncbi:hypothetical protein [Pedobacter agri]|uniref:hypothetical protein n=1 Tax=Pedobacter agri TaxID=454586 RepID=UPI0029308689|nr:hypothetical protein [Pedobacter agri]